ncbi:hypothetical protein TcYC6_0002160 [Trypanosoma cruzi]|nr:hypothetical protein TcYC6_0002160 [Trypanosoma cruzi]
MLEGDAAPSASGTVAGTQANSSGPEFNDATPSNVRKQFTIPKLDEKKLDMKAQEPHGTTTPFVVLDGGMSSGTTTTTVTAVTETSSMPLNSNAPAFVFGTGSRYTGGNVIAVDSPSANAAYLLSMQCQNPQYQLAHAAPTDQEIFLHKVSFKCALEKYFCGSSTHSRRSPRCLPLSFGCVVKRHFI